MKFTRPLRVTHSGDGNLLPLVNIVFLLLIFILLAGTLAPVDNMTVELPVSSAASSARAENTRLHLTRNGVVTVGGRKVTYAGLEQALSGRGVGPESHTHRLTPIQILADRRARSRDLQILLGHLSALGFENVQLITQRSQR